MNADRGVLNDRRICKVSIGTGQWCGEFHSVHGPLLYSNDLQSLEVDPHPGSREFHRKMRTLCWKRSYILVESYIQDQGVTLCRSTGAYRLEFIATGCRLVEEGK